ncbi:hypothetical protein SAMN06264855_1472 [Halorubrum vacuolatum]|uniref:Uncharacterized protein n=1 Tax=Halorubrum vacuolatum TaxID=63740 RepID=A0A238YIB1_HALVU|nr:hypothetical protein SAMN06264855_1472 [Halorubrum vacuolatum]
MSRVTDFYSPSPEELLNEEEELRELLEDETPSLDKGLVDLRQKFNEEEGRRRDIESKAAGILAVSGLLLTLLQFVYQEVVGGIVFIVLSLFLLISILLSLANLVPVGYMTIRLNPILGYSFEQGHEYTRQLYIKYHIATYNNQRINKSRLRVLHWSYYPLVLVLMVLAAILIILSSGATVRDTFPFYLFTHSPSIGYIAHNFMFLPCNLCGM